MTNRRFKDAGFEPLIAYIILAFAFVGFSVYLFYSTEFAEPVYLLSALMLTGQLSEIKRTDFLKLCFGNNKLKKIRITENLIITFPFVVFFTYRQLFLSALILIIVTILLALVNFGTTLNFAIPTPFYRKPFEFTVGFRNTFFLILAAYALTFIAVSVDNFNLGIFAMLLVFAVTLSYYTKPENEYYVWTYNLNAKRFLLEKIKTAVWYSSFLVFPLTLTLGIFFHQNISTLLFFFLMGYAFLICMIVSKYAAYPDELNVMQSILLALSISFPPSLIVLIPYLFRKSESRLRRLLS